MNTRFAAAWEIHKFLIKHKIPYAIIGGTALPRWGEPRFTKDVDLTVVTALEKGVAPFASMTHSTQDTFADGSNFLMNNS